MLDENLSLVEIGRILGMDKPNVTRAINRLVELDYVELHPSLSDRRKKMVKVKEETHNIYQELRTTINAYELEILEGVSEEEQRTIYNALKKIQQNLIKRAGEL
jgi:DNA-binding MarR family transcriptional regulator